MRIAPIAALLFALATVAPAQITVERRDGQVTATNGGPGRYAAADRQARAETPEPPRPEPPGDLDRLIRAAAEEAGLHAGLVRAVVSVESGFDPQAVSRKGARGLMQLMPDTAKAYGVEDVYDPRSNLRAGAQHLRGLLDRYDGNLSLALAAYNAGGGAVDRYGGVPPYRETQDYVRRVRELLEQERQPGSAGPRLFSYRDAGGTLVMSNVPSRGRAKQVRLAEMP